MTEQALHLKTYTVQV